MKRERKASGAPERSDLTPSLVRRRGTPMRKTMTLSLLLLAGVAGVALATSPPALINYQGVLRSASNAPLNGTFDMVFRFYDDLTGGNEILVDSHTGPGSV